MKTIDTLKNVIAEQLGIDAKQITPESRWGWHPLHEGAHDLGCDSLDAVEIVMAVEDEWEIQLGDDEASDCETVQQLANLIDRKIKPLPADPLEKRTGER